MASIWRKSMLYLGLGPDDEYDDYEAPDDRAAAPSPGPTPAREPATVSPRPSTMTRPRPVSQMPAPDAPPEASTVRPLPNPAAGEAKPRTVVRPVPATPTAKPFVVAPTSFNQAQDVADRFKASQPVIVNLQGVDRDLSRRLIDFASGLCYGLGGQMEKVAHQVYLLTPSNVEVSPEERRRLQERGLHDG
jgi:cell division inhibitor SepF